MNRLYCLLVTLVLLLAGNPSNAQSPVINTKIDAQKIVVGDQLRYFITVSKATNAPAIRWPKFPDTFNTLEIVEQGKIDTLIKGDQVEYKQRLLITGFDSGSFLIPRFPFVSNSSDTLFSDSFRVAVSTVDVDTSKAFKEIKGVVEVQVSWRDYIGIIAGIAIAVVVLVVLVVYLLKRRKPAIVSEPRPEETVDQKALRLLDELDAKQLWQQDKPKQYYTELSEIVRQYIEARFNTNAMELTTDELLRVAKKHREMTFFISSLKPLLHAADLAKFAKANPLPQEHIEALELARNFIRVSKPKVVNPQNPAAQK
jgi:hypothetical protein